MAYPFRAEDTPAVSVLAIALAFFTAFHFLPIGMGSGDERGWSLWTELARLLTRPQRLVTIEVRGFVMIAAFLTSPLLLVVAPFVVPVLRDSLWLRWLAIIVSTMALLGFSGMLLTRTEQGFGLGLYFYLVAQLFNVIGLLLIRRRPLPEEEFSPD